jgi:nitroreductase
MTAIYDDADTITTRSLVTDGLGSGALHREATDRLFREAHTAYAFTDEPVSDAELAEIYDLARYAPTAMNTQPLRITFIRSDEAKARLLPHLAEGNRAKAASAPVVAILSADTDFHETLPRLLPHVPNARDRFADDVAREQAAPVQCDPAGRLRHPGDPGGRSRRGADGRLRQGRARRRVPVRDGAEVVPRRQHRPCGRGRHLPAQPAPGAQ